MKSFEHVKQKAKEAFEGEKPQFVDALRLGRDKMLVSGCWAVISFNDHLIHGDALNFPQEVGIAFGTTYGLAVGSGVGQALDSNVRYALSFDENAHKPWGAYGSFFVGIIGAYYGNSLTHDLVTEEWLPQKVNTEFIQPAPQGYLERQKDFQSGVVKGTDGQVLVFE